MVVRLVVGRRTVQVNSIRHRLAHTCTNTSKQNKFMENLKLSDFPDDPYLIHTGSCLNYIRREGEGER